MAEKIYSVETARLPHGGHGFVVVIEGGAEREPEVTPIIYSTLDEAQAAIACLEADDRRLAALVSGRIGPFEILRIEMLRHTSSIGKFASPTDALHRMERHAAIAAFMEEPVTFVVHDASGQEVARQ